MVLVDLGRGLAALALLGVLGCSGPGPRQPAPSPVASVSPASSPAPSPSPSPLAGEGSEQQPALEGSSIQSRGDNPWRLEATRIQYDDDKKTARVGTLTWTLMDKQGKKLVEVEGDGARVDLEGQKVHFEGPVVARGARGEVLNVQDLVWDGKARQFLGSQGVRMVRGDSTLTGRRMKASPDLRRLEVEGDVRVTMPEDAASKGAGR